MHFWLSQGAHQKFLNHQNLYCPATSLTVEAIWVATWQNQQSECVPSEDSDQPRHLVSLIRVFAVRMKKAWVLSYPLSAQWRLWSDWANSQADLSLHWGHTHFVGFVMSWLIYHSDVSNTCTCKNIHLKKIQSIDKTSTLAYRELPKIIVGSQHSFYEVADRCCLRDRNVINVSIEPRVFFVSVNTNSYNQVGKLLFVTVIANTHGKLKTYMSNVMWKPVFGDVSR